MEKQYSVSQAASMLNVTPTTIREWENTGKLRAVRTPGNQRRIPESEILRLRGEQVALDELGFSMYHRLLQRISLCELMLAGEYPTVGKDYADFICSLYRLCTPLFLSDADKPLEWRLPLLAAIKSAANMVEGSLAILLEELRGLEHEFDILHTCGGVSIYVNMTFCVNVTMYEKSPGFHTLYEPMQASGFLSRIDFNIYNSAVVLEVYKAMYRAKIAMDTVMTASNIVKYKGTYVSCDIKVVDFAGKHERGEDFANYVFTADSTTVGHSQLGDVKVCCALVDFISKFKEAVEAHRFR